MLVSPIAVLAWVLGWPFGWLIGAELTDPLSLKAIDLLVGMVLPLLMFDPAKSDGQ